MILQNMLTRAQLVLTTLVLAAAACAQPERPAEKANVPPAPAATVTVAPGATPGALPGATAGATPGATRPRIVFLGDSLTAGLGLQPNESVPSLIQARIEQAGYRYEVINAGVSGDTSAGGLRRLDWSLDGQVAFLVIELGANDGLRGLPVADMKRNLDAIITAAKRRNITVVLTGMEAPPNYGAAYTSEFRQVFADLAKQHSVHFMPFFLEGVAGNPALNQGDGIHPNPQGARIIEGNIWSALEPLLDRE